MPTTIEGIYRNGKIELSETPSDVCEGTRVIVAFFPSGSVDLQEHGIDKAQAAELRARLAALLKIGKVLTDIYDNYDEEKAKLQTR